MPCTNSPARCSPRSRSATRPEERSREALGEQALVELTGVVGYYVLVAMTPNALRTPLPDGAPDPFADSD